VLTFKQNMPSLSIRNAGSETRGRPPAAAAPRPNNSCPPLGLGRMQLHQVRYRDFLAHQLLDFPKHRRLDPSGNHAARTCLLPIRISLKNTSAASLPRWGKTPSSRCRVEPLFSQGV